MGARKRTGRAATVAAAFALLASGCGSEPAAPTGPRVAIVHDAAFPDGRSLVTPAVLAAELGLRQGGIEPIVVDAGVSPASVATDDRIVAAIVAPFTSPEVLADLVATGIPVVSLSQADPPAGEPVLRMGPSAGEVGAAVAALAGDDACLVAGHDPWAAREADSLASIGALSETDEPGGCGTIVLSASATEATAVRKGSTARLVLTDQARTMGFLGAVGPGAGPTWGVCGCVDTGSSADPALQGFVHAYQEETGLDPGPYAAEGFDAALVLQGSATQGRAAVAAALRALRTYDGVAGLYRWGEDGVLIEPRIRTYQAEGVRWVPA
jgi:ABC-type branched-subunit amino acid transport system substrate-binding protein